MDASVVDKSAATAVYVSTPSCLVFQSFILAVLQEHYVLVFGFCTFKEIRNAICRNLDQPVAGKLCSCIE